MSAVVGMLPAAKASELSAVAKLILPANAEPSEDAIVDATTEFKKQQQDREKRRFTQQLNRTMRYLGLTKRDKPNAITFVCIDMEAYEFNQNRITEIGISTLDTQHASSIAPGPQAKGWVQYLKTRHIRIEECKHLVNSRHIQGCPDYFDFGESEWLSQHKIIAFLTAIFTEAQQLRDGKTILRVLVGHNIESDIQYMMKSGFDVLAHISDRIDTQDLNKAIRRDNRSRNLGALLLEYHIKADHLHNAGNDAHYTLRLLLAICEAQYSWPKSSEQWNQEMQRQIKKEIELAEAKVRKQFEGWDGVEPEVDGVGERAELERLKMRKVNVQSQGAESQSLPSRGRGRGRGLGRVEENLSFRGGRRGTGRGLPSYRQADTPVAQQAMPTYGTGYGQYQLQPIPPSQRDRKNYKKSGRDGLKATNS